jgi:hypothetical protein
MAAFSMIIGKFPPKPCPISATFYHISIGKNAPSGMAARPAAQFRRRGAFRPISR